MVWQVKEFDVFNGNLPFQETVLTFIVRWLIRMWRISHLFTNWLRLLRFMFVSLVNTLFVWGCIEFKFQWMCWVQWILLLLNHIYKTLVFNHLSNWTVHLSQLSRNDIFEISEEFGNLTNLTELRVRFFRSFFSSLFVLSLPARLFLFLLDECKYKTRVLI